MADVASKQQTTALFLSTTVTRTRRHTELTKKIEKNLTGKLCCAKEQSVQFFVQLFYTVKLYSLTWSVWGPLECMGSLTLRTHSTRLLGALSNYCQNNTTPSLSLHRAFRRDL